LYEKPRFSGVQGEPCTKNRDSGVQGEPCTKNGDSQEYKANLVRKNGDSQEYKANLVRKNGVSQEYKANLVRKTLLKQHTAIVQSSLCTPKNHAETKFLQETWFLNVQVIL